MILNNNNVPEAQALDLFETVYCDEIYEIWELVGTRNFYFTYNPDETARFCISMFEQGIRPIEVKEHYENSKAGIQIDFPEKWSGFEVDTKNMTMAFVIPDKILATKSVWKVQLEARDEPIWMMLTIMNVSAAHELQNTISNIASENLVRDPKFLKTCKFSSQPNTEINNMKAYELSIVCFDADYRMDFDMESYSFITKDNLVTVLSTTWHASEIEIDNPSFDESLGTLVIENVLDITDLSNVAKIPTTKEKTQIPDWIRNNAEWWAGGAISDSDFVGGIQYLIKENIMEIPETTKAATPGVSQEIPSWIKNNAEWWSQGLITDDDFVKGIQYLVEQGIILV